MYDVKINNTNDAIAYVIYMIVGSYFKKTVCKSTMKEKQLKVVYGETKRDTQIKLEERCIKYVESKLLSIAPEEIFDDMAEVHFKLNKEANRIDVIFTGFDWRLTMWGDNTSKGIMFDYKLITDDPDED